MKCTYGFRPEERNLGSKATSQIFKKKKQRANEAAAYLEYPDARDAGELVGGDGLCRGGVVAAAAAAVQAETAAEAREARGQRVAGAIGARRRVAHPSGRRKRAEELVKTNGTARRNGCQSLPQTDRGWGSSECVLLELTPEKPRAF